VGVGKTTILRAYLERKTPQKQKQKTIYIFNPVLSYHGLLTAIFRSLDLVPRHDDVTEMVNQLHEALIAEYQAGGTVVLAIDEAQNMPVETLENLRMLSNLETSTDKLIQIILLGQPELNDMLSQPALRQFQQRIALRATINPLTEEESRAFIQHRIARASISGSPLLFTKRALHLIARQAKGIPRRINILCDNALITGYGRQCNPIPVSVVKEIIRDMDVKEASSTPSYVGWAVGLGVAIALMAGMAFFFNSPFNFPSNAKTETLANKVEGRTSKMTTGSGITSSSGVSQTTQTQNSISSSENAQKFDNKTDATKLGVQHSEESPEIVATKATSQDHLASLPKEVNTGTEGDITQFTVKEEGDGSNYINGAIDTKSKSENSFELSSLNIKKKETIATPEGEATVVTRTVKEGENLSLIAGQVYGSQNPKYLEWVQQHNPQILDPHIILPGQQIVLPEYRKNKAPQ